MNKIIDEKLNIQACTIGDLNIETVKGLLEVFGDNASISTLTVFRKDEAIILNEEHDAYTQLKNLALTYMSADEATREKIKKHAGSKTFIDAIEVFDSALMLREVKHKRYIVRHQPWHEEDICMCYKLIGNEEKYGVFDLISTCFNYGYMRGVQDERKKKNKRI